MGPSRPVEPLSTGQFFCKSAADEHGGPAHAWNSLARAAVLLCRSGATDSPRFACANFSALSLGDGVRFVPGPRCLRVSFLPSLEPRSCSRGDSPTNE